MIVDEADISESFEFRAMRASLHFIPRRSGRPAKYDECFLATFFMGYDFRQLLPGRI